LRARRSEQLGVAEQQRDESHREGQPGQQLAAGRVLDGQEGDHAERNLHAADRPGGQQLHPGAVQPRPALLDHPVQGLFDLIVT
jgi:hypothetical protein